MNVLGLTVDEVDVKRFMEMVELPEANCPDCCWYWRGSISRDGHGQFSVGGRHIYAHRFAAAVTGADICSTCMVLHKCGHSDCVNPRHLKVGDHIENMRDMILDGGSKRALAKKVERYGGASKPVPEWMKLGIITMHDHGAGVSTIAKMTNLALKTVRGIVRAAEENAGLDNDTEAGEETSDV